MNRSDFILRSLSKLSSKRWEHYVINRIYHRLDDPEIEFVCQQCIRGSDSKIYLVDLFLPQLDIYLEIDEGHHDTDIAKMHDAARRLDIVEAAGLIEERIPASNKTLSEIDRRVETFVELVRERKAAQVRDGRFRDWDYEQRFSPQRHLEEGYIEVGPHSAFWSQRDALRCFGYGGGHYQRGVWRLPVGTHEEIGLLGKAIVWFPRLYEQADWSNSLSDDGKTITEVSKKEVHYREAWNSRIVMARSRDEFNRTLYRFLGLFEVVPEYSDGKEHRFVRVATRLKTISAKGS